MDVSPNSMTHSKNEITDTALILRCNEGDQQAFGILVERHQSTAFRFAFRLSCETMGAEDLCQKAFLRLWNYRDRIKPDSKLTTLLYTIISRLWIDSSRSQKQRFFNRQTDVLHDRIISDDASPETLSINQDLVERIKRLCKKLPARQRLVFTLRDLEDLSINEVVQITGISRGGVKTNLSIARRKIREKLLAITGIES